VPRFSEELIQQIAAASDIVEVIGGYFPLKRAGPAYKALCPFHQERSPSFTVSPSRQIFKCFGCGAGGSVFRFVMDYEHLEFTAAVRKLAERAGIRVELEELSGAEREHQDLRRRLLALHADAAGFFHQQLLRAPGASVARNYLKTRGITSQVAKAWNLGYAPEGWDHLLRWAADRNYSREELLASGLVSQRDPDNPRSDFYDRFRGRVMFPICNDTGEVIAFSGRILEADAKGAKYVNSPETQLFTKGAVLFGLHRSKRALIEKSCAIVCEGQLDLITAFEAGVQNVIAPQGTAFTARQARILKRYVEEVILCFDSDVAGEKAAERSLPALLSENLSVRVATLPKGEDPDSLIRSQGADAFRSRMDGALDFFDAQLDRLSLQPDFDSPRGRNAAARKLAESLGWLQDPVLRSLHVQKHSTRLGLAGSDFGALVTEAAARNRALNAQQSAARPGSDEAHPGSGATQPTRSRPDRIAPLDPTLELLAVVLLQSAEARQWLLEEDWQRRLEAEPQGEIIEAILKGARFLDDPAHAQSFFIQLPPEQEAFLAALMENRSPDDPLCRAQECWDEIERRQLRRRIEGIKAKQRSPNLALEEAAALHQQILDLQKRLFDITRPFSPLRQPFADRR
jgi:DNA primase